MITKTDTREKAQNNTKFKLMNQYQFLVKKLPKIFNIFQNSVKI